MSLMKLTAAGAVLAWSVAACTGGGGTEARGERRLPDVELASSLRRFDSCDEVRSWVRDELAPHVGAYGLPGSGFGLLEGGADDAASARESAATPTTALDATSYSRTNVQVEGVDEPDIVKTDGSRIVVAVDGRLRLVAADSGAVLDSIALPEGMHDGQLLLAGDRVLVSGADGFHTGVAEDRVGSFPAPQAPTTRVVEVDLSGDKLVVADTYVLDGSYVSARMTDDVARLVLHASPEARLPLVTPATPSEDATARAQAANREVVEQAAPEDFLPKWRRLGPDGEVAAEGALLGCEQAHAPETFSGFGIVTVVSIDLSEGLGGGITASRATGVMAGGQTVYASPEYLYVAAPEWVDWESLPDPGQRDASERRGTDIHRFDIRDPRESRYDMSGHVDGELLDQFAMDEHDGNLRVATTTGAPWVEDGEGESVSHVAVLAPQNGALTQIGRVTGLGPGETIQSVRFLGPLGWVVTFEQTDPLYTLDLSDPANPRVAGELKMLGFSAYLHPVADGYLVGVGQDATEDGRQLGTQVALYDVRDPAAPARVAQATLPSAGSGAEWDHHAFLWWPATGLAAIPVSSYDENPSESLVGYGIDVDAATITERGRVQHPPVAVDGESPGVPFPLPVEPGAGTSGAVEPPNAPVVVDYTPPIMRSFVIGETLWTLSSAGLATSDLATLAPIDFVAFP